MPKTCNACHERDFTTQRRRVEFDGVGYTDMLDVECWMDAQRIQRAAVEGAVTVGR